MLLAVPKEILCNEQRVAALPETVAEFIKCGFEVAVEAGAGAGTLRLDAEYQKAGARIVADVPRLFGEADLIIKVKQPWFNEQLKKHEVEMMRERAVLVSFLHPAAPASHTMVTLLRDRKITAFTMDDVPRTSRAQRMDALTSMSTITGYKSVLMAANRLPKFIPMIGTAIGTIKAAKVLVVGAGVVGLQAIATAKRLGASVTAMDIRQAARQAAESLGAKLVAFDIPPDLTQAAGGYAKALPQEWLMREREALAGPLAESDIVILSALVPGEEAPLLVTNEMVQRMRAGSVVVDVAIDQGGNCTITEGGREAVKHGVHLCGLWNIPGAMPVHASWLYANNILEYVKNLFKNGSSQPDMSDEINRQSLVTHAGEIVHQGTIKAMTVRQSAAA